MIHPIAQAVFRQRKAMVEPVFSALRQQQELSRFRRRGLAGVKRELALHVLAYNLARAVALSLHCFFMGSLVGLSEFILSSTEKDRNCLVIKIVEQLFHHMPLMLIAAFLYTSLIEHQKLGIA